MGRDALRALITSSVLRSFGVPHHGPVRAAAEVGLVAVCGVGLDFLDGCCDTAILAAFAIRFGREGGTPSSHAGKMPASRSRKFFAVRNFKTC